MTKEKLIGAIIGVILSVLGAFGVLSSDAVKSEVCGTSTAPSK